MTPNEVLGAISEARHQLSEAKNNLIDFFTELRSLPLGSNRFELKTPTKIFSLTVENNEGMTYPTISFDSELVDNPKQGDLIWVRLGSVWTLAMVSNASNTHLSGISTGTLRNMPFAVAIDSDNWHRA